LGSLISKTERIGERSAMTDRQTDRQSTLDKYMINIVYIYGHNPRSTILSETQHVHLARNSTKNNFCTRRFLRRTVENSGIC